MKIKDLLEELKNINPEADISFRMADGCCGDYFDLDEPSIDSFNYKDKEFIKHVCLIDFMALDFLASCRASAAAQTRAKMCKKD